LRLRKSSITDEHLAIRKSYSQDTEEFQNSAEALTQNMQDMTRELVAVVNKLFWDSRLDVMWTLVRDWFRNDILGSKMPDEQVWIVD
jgi:hypothetical protein